MGRVQDITVREGEVTTFNLYLVDDNGAVDLTSADHVSLVLIPNNGAGTRTEYSSTGAKVDYDADANGRVYWIPADGDVTKANSPYVGYVLVYDTATTMRAFPNSRDALIKVLVK